MGGVDVSLCGLSWGSNGITIEEVDFGEVVRGRIEETAGGGVEYCGSMRVSYSPGAGYIVSGFVEGVGESSSVECRTSVGGNGFWHTHPAGMCGASGVDRRTMELDARLALEGDVPGVPPVNLIFTRRGDGYCVRGYLPSWDVSCRVLERPDKWVVDVLPDVRGDQWFSYHAIEVVEDRHPLGGDVFYRVSFRGELDRGVLKGLDRGFAGVYLGSRFPPHAVPGLLVFVSRVVGGSFWVFHELTGLHKVEVSRSRPIILESNCSIGATGWGRRARMSLLESEHGFPLSSLSNVWVTVFGAGFLGTRIAEALAPYVGGVILVDGDFVGVENIGYQALYDLGDLGLPKGVAAARRLYGMFPWLTVVPVRHIVPDGRRSPSRLVLDVARMSDVLVTAFDSLGPRLTVQLAASAAGKPLVDVALGVDDAVVRVWRPGCGLACRGCYMYDPLAFSGEGNVYASHPYLAWMAASVAAERALYLARGGDVEANVGWLKLSDKGVIVEWKRVEEEVGCPYHSRSVELALTGEGVEDMSFSVSVKVAPWKSVAELRRKLSRLLVGGWRIRLDENRYVGDDASIAWIHRMARNLVLEPVNEGLADGFGSKDEERLASVA